MFTSKYPYRNRLSVSALIAATLHLLLIAGLVLVHTTADEPVVFSIPAGDPSLAPLPSVEQSGANFAQLRNQSPRNIVSFAPTQGSLKSVAPLPVQVPTQHIAADTNQKNPNEHTTVHTQPAQKFTTSQDTTYARGKCIIAPPGVRLQRDLTLTDSAWGAEQQRRANTVEGTIQRNLAFSPKEIIPSGQMQIAHDRDMKPGAPSDIMPNISRAGVSFTFSARSLLGLDEDVSATFSYTLTRQSHVLVSIYTVRGEVVAKLLDGTQSTGKHSMTWDGLDGHGEHVQPGDYVVEIVINNEVRMTKRIVMG